MRARVCALLAVLPLLITRAHGQFLSGPTQFGFGANFTSFVKADINGDGRADVLGVSSPAAGRFGIVVLLNNGTGGFGMAVNTVITGIDNPKITPFVVADFNGDGRPDVAFQGVDHVLGIPVVAVMLGNGDGTFQAPLKSPAPAAALLNSGDFNGDGKIDLVTCSPNGFILSVLLGKGDGTFSAPTTSSVVLPNGIAVMTTGDFNNDTKSDLVVAGGSRLSILLGNGDGTFQSPLLISNKLPSTSLVTGELNADSNLDFIAGGNAGLAVFLGDGTGHFAQQIYAVGSPFSKTIAVDDLNGDGHPDIAFLDDANVAITILLNNGDGAFTVGRSYNGDQGTNGFITADVNGDHKIDLVTGNAKGGVSVIVGNGDGTFRANQFVSPGHGFEHIQLGDFNGDGRLDIVGVSTGVLLGNGDGTFKPLIGGLSGFSSIVVGGFNLDGNLDVAGNTSSPAVGVYLGKGDGTFTFGGDYDQGIPHTFILPGDFNNDGKLDIAATDQHGISILLGAGDGSFQNGIVTPLNTVSSNPPLFGVGDFNKDGNLDIATVTPPGITVLLGNGDGTFAPPLISSGSTAGRWTVVDLNKDGNLDAVVVGRTGIDVLVGNGDGTFKVPVHYIVSPTSTITNGRAGVADFNGDGNLDVAVGDSDGMIDVFFGDGLGNLSAPKRFRLGGIAGEILAGDFNGDRVPDLAVAIGHGLVILLNQK